MTEESDLGLSQQSPGDERSHLASIPYTGDDAIDSSAEAFASSRNRFFSHFRYKSLLEELFALPLSPSFAPDRSRSEFLDKALSYPTSHYPVVHVGGSNGKGSVATKIAKTLSLSGYKVGLYTSPHLYCYRERICINGEKISEEEVVVGITKLKEIAKNTGISFTFFELTTFLAFEHFKNSNIDIAVVEVGLGGKFDATNGVSPILSVITSISKEHTAILGATLDEIALQKGGIIKPNTPIVLGKTAQLPLLFELAKERSSPLFCVEGTFPFFDEENTETAKLCLQQLSTAFPFTKDALQEGLQSRPSCRFEIQDSILFDVAHNPAAIASLLEALALFFPDKKLRFLLSFSQDKDYPLCLKLISRIATHIHLTSYGSERSTPIHLLSHELREQNFHSYTEHSSVREGFFIAKKTAQEKEELLIICGSFYMMKETSYNKELCTTPPSLG